MFKKLTLTGTIIVVALAVISALLFHVTLVSGAGEPSPIMITEVAWMGTQASSSDEWFELTGTDFFDVPLEGWTVVIAKTNGATTTINLSGEVPVNGVVLFERTDQNTVSTITGTLYAGGMANSDFEAMHLINPDGEFVQTIAGLEGEWPSGNEVSKGSMQWSHDGGFWFASNRSNGELDANGNPILGTPGSLNDAGPTTECEPLPDNFTPAFEFVMDDTMLFTPTLTIEANVFGIDPNPKTGYAVYEWQSTTWQVVDYGWDEGTTNSCIDAIENLKDAGSDLLNGSTVDEMPPNWTFPDGFVELIEAIREFQKSGMSFAFLPAMMKENR